LELDARGHLTLPICFGEALYEDFEEVANVNHTPYLFNHCYCSFSDNKQFFICLCSVLVRRFMESRRQRLQLE
jgi:hypothetical protein